MKTQSTAKLLCLLALLSGCAITEPYRRPQTPVSDEWRHALATETSWPDTSWWSGFESPELLRLIELAEHNNYDLAAAGHRIAQARANVRIAGAALWPFLDAGASFARSRVGSSDGFARTSSSHEAALAASYELDVWGLNRASRDAALASLASSIYARETARITLVSDTATTYFQVLSFSDRLGTAQRQLDNARALLSLLEVQYRAGAISQLEVERQRNLVASLEAAIPPLNQQREQALDALAVLLGVPPRELSTNGDSLARLSFPSIVPGLPSELLARRPDIRRAEADLISANANLAAARAALFPRIELTARSGLQSASLAEITSSGAFFWTLAAGLTAPIFDGGRLRGERDFAEARRDELVAQYQQTVLASLRDVEDALVALAELSTQQAAQERALAHAREAYRLAELRWRAGAVDFTTVLDAQRTLYSEEAALDPIRLSRFNATVALFRALGGDWGGEPASRGPA